MSGDLRRDPLTGAWTIIAPGRRARPHDTDDVDTGPVCPFCEGNEGLTPPEVDAFRARGGQPDTPGWSVRVVPNKFPLLEGAHEVVVHSPRHESALAELPAAAVTEVVAMYQRRIAAHCAGGAAAVTVIVNQGGAAGASLDHPHSQVLATPIVPPVLAAELDEFERYRDEFDRCLLCDLVQSAAEREELLVFDGPIVAWAPEASRFPYELRLAPRLHEPSFVSTGASAAGGALRRALAALAAVTGEVGLNLWLHTAPCAGDRPFHWHVEVAPRLSTLAGFELGTGIGIDLVEPREAAGRLRQSDAELGGGEAGGHEARTAGGAAEAGLGRPEG